MKIVCIGAGPAGLHAACLLKRADPQRDIRVMERMPAGMAPGWGVVLSDGTLEALARDDVALAAAIEARAVHWDRIDIHIRGDVLSAGGHGFQAISRRSLLGLLEAQAQAAGVIVDHGAQVGGVDDVAEADLVLVADGASSRIRSAHAAHFGTAIDVRPNRYLWLGLDRRLDAFCFVFVETPWGWLQAHAYPFDETRSTVVVEMPEPVWRESGQEHADAILAVAFCQHWLADFLGHARLLSADGGTGSPWRQFARIANERWIKDRLVLLGDAAHTAHFSIGVGTRMALEDASALAAALGRDTQATPQALARYVEPRRIESLKLQSAARNSTDWFENVARYARLPPEQFAHSLLTRSQRLGHAVLRRRDPDYVGRVERHLAGGGNRSVPPMFMPFRLRDLALANRVVVSPMAVYRAEDGVPGDFHLAHLGARAMGGAGLVMTEMVAVEPMGRITHGCPGLYRPDQATAWRRITDFIHRESRAAIGIQLGHAGPKGATKRGWEGMDEPLDEHEAWPLLGPGGPAWSPDHAMPQAMGTADMARVIGQFERAAQFAEEAGFDLVEIHAAHGYLLSSFISPLSNHRRDTYGGSLDNRLRFPLEIFHAVRAVWPAHKPISVRISAHDWVPDGITPADAVAIAEAFRDAGADLIDVSAGQTSRLARPVYGRMFQTPFADRIRNEAGIATMAVGNITEADQINTIIAAGRADLCALARPHLADPHFTLRAASAQRYLDQSWPLPYLAGKEQLDRLASQGEDAGDWGRSI